MDHERSYALDSRHQLIGYMRTIIICLVVSVAVIGALSGFYLINRPPLPREAFQRNFSTPKTLEPIATLDLSVNSFYIAGLTEKLVFFANSTAPNHMVLATTALRDTQHIFLKMPDTVSHLRKSLRIWVDSSTVTLSHGQTALILQADLESLQYKDVGEPGEGFINGLRLSSNSFVFRRFDKIRDDTYLQKFKNKSFMPGVVSMLHKQGEGIFSTDGTLSYNPKRQELYYVFFYRNEILALDTNLQVKYRDHTIDSNSVAKINVGKISSTESTMIKSTMINQRSCADGQYLYVCSKLMGQGEDESDFRSSSVVDVYDLDAHRYRVSFYLKDHNDRKIDELKVFERKIYVRHGRLIVQYEVPDIPGTLGNHSIVEAQ